MSENTEERQFASMAEKRRFEAFQAKREPAPSAGAMRAARALHPLADAMEGGNLLEEEARIIDRESGLMDAQSVLEDCEDYLKHDPNVPADLLRHVRLVLAKIEGGA